MSDRHDMFALQRELEASTRAIENLADHVKKMKQLESLGYVDVRELKPGYYCGVIRFIYTCGVCCGLDEWGYDKRFCFDTMQNARLFLRDWDGVTIPEVGIDGCTAIK